MSSFTGANCCGGVQEHKVTFCSYRLYVSNDTTKIWIQVDECKQYFSIKIIRTHVISDNLIQGDQKLSVHLMITVQKQAKINSFNHLPC
jgi:hypothetical protein